MAIGSDTFKEVIQIVLETAGKQDVDKLSSALKSVGDAAAAADPKAEALLDELARVNEVDKAVKSLAGLKARLQETGDNLFQAKRGLADLNREFAAADRSSKAVDAAFRRAEKAVADLTKEERSLEVAIAKANGTIAKHGLDAGNLAKADQQVRDRAHEAAKAVSEFGAAAASAATGTERIEKSGSRAAASLQSIREGVNSAVSGLLRITGIAGAVSAALTGLGVGQLFKGAVSSARDFESELSQVRAVSGATAEQLSRMRAAAEDASKTTTFSAQEAAQALGELARASGNADDAIRQLPATLSLAQAAGIGAAEAASIITTTLTQFGLGANDAAHAADLFAREANSTNDTVTKLGLSMSYVAPLARQLGISLDDTVAILGALAEQGFKGERAGTALRNVFSQLLDPASNFRQELLGLNITGNDFSEIIKGLAAAGDKGKKALLALDSEARPAIAALVTSAGADIQRLKQDFVDVTGESQRTAQIMGDNFEGASKRFGSALDSIRRSLVDPILDPLAKQMDAASARIRAFSETAEFDKIKQAVKDFATSAATSIVQFVQGIDFTSVATKLSSFATDAKAFFKDVGEGSKKLFATLGVVANTVSTVFNGAQTFVLGFATVVSGALSLGAKAVELYLSALGRIPGAGRLLSGAIEEVKQVSIGLDGVMREFAERTAKNGKETAEALDKLAKSIADVGKDAPAAKSGLESVAGAADGLARPIAEAGNQLQLLPDYLAHAEDATRDFAGPMDDTRTAALGFAAGVDTASQAVLRFKGGPIQDATKALHDAERAYAELLMSGRATPATLAAAGAAINAAARELENVKASAAGAVAGTEALQTAFTNLGIQSQADLATIAATKKASFDLIASAAPATAAGLADVKNAFIAYAESALAAAAAGDAATKSQTDAALASKASALGLTNQLEALKQKLADAGKAGVDSGRQLQQGFGSATEGAQKTTEAVRETTDTVDSMQQRGGSALNALASELANTRKGFSELSDAAAAMFDTFLGNLERTRTSIGPGLGFDTVRENMRIAAEETAQAIETQRQQLEGAIHAAEQFGATGAAAMSQVANATHPTTASIEQMIASTKAGANSFDLLGKEELGPLISALESARSRTEALEQQAKSAADALDQMADSAQDALDRASGNETAIENRRFEEDLARIKELAAQGGAAAAAAAARARANAEALHKDNLRRIAEERQARLDEERDVTTARRNGGSSGGSGGGGSAAGQGGIARTPANNAGPTVIVNVGGSLIASGMTKDQLAESLARLVRPQLRRLDDLDG